MVGLALTVVGIIFLIKRRIPYGKKREVRGPLIGLISLLLIVPFPCFLVYGFMLGWDAANNGQELDDKELLNLTLFVELPVYLGDALVCWLIVAASAQPVRSKRWRDDDEDDDNWRRRDEDDDRYERRRRHFEDDRDDRPRGRYEDDDERPRRSLESDSHEEPKRGHHEDDDERPRGHRGSDLFDEPKRREDGHEDENPWWRQK